MKFTDLNNTEVVFKDCPVHNGLRYAGASCPVCETDAQLRQQAARIAELEFELQEERDPL